MSAVAAIIALGFLFCAYLAWKMVELIAEASEREDDDSDHDPQGPIDYRRFHQ